MSNAKNKAKGSDVKVAPDSNGEGSETKQASSKETKQTLNPSKSYIIVATVSNNFLKEGKEYNVTGKLAEKMINNNQAKLKD